MDNDKNSRDLLGPLRPDTEDLAYVDSLTGLFNQRLVGELFDQRFDDLVELADSFAVVMIDLDLFKVVNDKYGHLSGDKVLRETAHILRSAFRDSDLIFRYGGDEFLVLLPGASASEAEALGRRAREAMQRYEFLAPEEKERIDVPLSFSIGVAAYPADGDSGRAILALADTRLYGEKRVQLAARRRKRNLITGAAVVVAVRAVGFGMHTLFDRPDETPVRPLVLIEPPTPVEQDDEAERDALLLQIGELQRQIEDLRSAQTPQQSSPSPSPQIEVLERRVAELTDQLEARPKETPEREVVEAKPDRAVQAEPVDVPRRAPVDVQQETAPAVPRKSRVVPPRLRKQVAPLYPMFAKERGMEATIDVEVLIDEMGRVAEAKAVGKPVGFGFEAAARQAALDSEWIPATRNGVPIPMRTTLQVRFKIAR